MHAVALSRQPARRLPHAFQLKLGPADVALLAHGGTRDLEAQDLLQRARAMNQGPTTECFRSFALSGWSAAMSAFGQVPKPAERPTWGAKWTSAGDRQVPKRIAIVLTAG